jgi:hypothetical protein
MFDTSSSEFFKASCSFLLFGTLDSESFKAISCLYVPVSARSHLLTMRQQSRFIFTPRERSSFD